MQKIKNVLFGRSVQSSRINPQLRFALIALVLGQILFLYNIGWLYVIALIYTFTIGVPYPKVLRSIVSRLIASFLLTLSIIQVAAAVQFFLFPKSTFVTLSILTTLAAIGLVWLFKKRPHQAVVLADKKDLTATIAALFFAIPFAVLCFWQNNPAHIAAFTSIQGSDGASHYIAITEMSGVQHLNYQTTEYYPKGFHIASALLLHGLHANQPDQDWATNARIYAGMYLAWGIVLTFMVIYFAAQLCETLASSKRPPLLLLALSIGPILTLVYLFNFALEGFVSYFYICAAVLYGILYLYDASQEKRIHQWPVVAYLLLTFGIAMSWGPLLTPALLLIPLLYLWTGRLNRSTFFRSIIRPEWRWVTVAFILQLIPLYLHLKYAHLSSQQGLNATGGITAFHYGPILAGLVVVCYALYSTQLPAVWQKVAGNVLLPLYILVGAFVCIQYLSVGELRYYAIKTAYLLEIIVLVFSAVLLATALYRTKITTLHRWIAFPVLLGFGMVLLVGITSNPFAQARPLLKEVSHIKSIDPDVAHYTSLGLKDQLDGTNTAVLHYNETAGTLTGDAILTNWVNLMQYQTDSTPASGACSGQIFTLEAYEPITQDNQRQLTSSVKDCITAALARHRPYFIVTDTHSVDYLRALFGSSVTYIY